MPALTANDTELYYELTGAGPPVLMIMGATGDAGHFERVAELLADEFTVVTYDRRGNGRSPRPPGWTATSAEEQADDAAALLSALKLGPAAVFGTSLAGVIALCMLLRHPGSVRGAILHEPAFWSLFDDPDDVRRRVGAQVAEGMEAGGPPAALEAFYRFVAGDANWERLDDTMRKRLRAAAGTYFEVESGAFASYMPDEETLAAIDAPVRFLLGDESLPEFGQAARRFAPRLGVEITPVAGAHYGYLDHPEELVEAIRPFLRALE